MSDFLLKKVADVMTVDVVTIRPETSLADVVSIFETHDFNALPVVSEGKFEGLVTKVDVLRAFVFTPSRVMPAYAEIMTTPVRTVMQRSPLFVTADLPLSRVLQKLVDTSVKSFPVFDGDQLVGMISREDILNALRGEDDDVRSA